MTTVELVGSERKEGQGLVTERRKFACSTCVKVVHHITAYEESVLVQKCSRCGSEQRFVKLGDVYVPDTFDRFMRQFLTMRFMEEARAQKTP